MLTLVLQNLVTLCDYLFAGFALAAAPADAAASPPRAAWRLTGVAFLAVAIVKTVQNAWGTWAFFAGSEAEVYRAFILWMPVANHARAVMTLVFGALLLAVAGMSAVPRRFWAVSHGLLLGGLLLGAVLGWLEGAFREAQHYSMTSLFSVVELMLLGSALVVALVRASLDRLLWVCFAAYLTYEALNAAWFAGLAWLSVPGAWVPSLAALQALRLTVLVLMTGVAWHRFRLERAGLAVPALLETAEPRPAMPLAP